MCGAQRVCLRTLRDLREYSCKKVGEHFYIMEISRDFLFGYSPMLVDNKE